LPFGPAKKQLFNFSPDKISLVTILRTLIEDYLNHSHCEVTLTDLRANEFAPTFKYRICYGKPALHPNTEKTNHHPQDNQSNPPTKRLVRMILAGFVVWAVGSGLGHAGDVEPASETAWIITDWADH